LFKFHESFMTCKWDAMYLLFKEKLQLILQEIKLENVNFFGMIWNCDIFKDEAQVLENYVQF
jgi:hypothetical protein